MKNRNILLILFFLSILYFAQTLGIHGIEYRDDEIFYYKSTQKMLKEHNFLSPVYFDENRFQKPILYYWFIIISYYVFGLGWFAARFTSVLAASAVMVLTWLMAKDFFNKKVATLSVCVLATLPMFFRHAKNAVPDMTLNFFVVLAVYCALKFLDDESRKSYGYLFFISCGLGFMIKGFAALVVPVLTFLVYAAMIQKKSAIGRINFLTGVLILFLIIAPWFWYMSTVYGEKYVTYMTQTETLGRFIDTNARTIFSGIAYTITHNSLFYLRTILSYFAPWSIFGFMAIALSTFQVVRRQEGSRRLLPFVIWFFVVFIFFSIVASRINHLVLVLTTPFAILVAYFFTEALDEKTLSCKILRALSLFLIGVIVIAGLLGISFVKVFFLGSSRLWLLVFLGLLILSFRFIFRPTKMFLPALFVSVFLIFSYLQSFLLSRAKLTSLTALQEMAGIIQRQKDFSGVIGVGSYDIHEKELQVYFDEKVQKLGANTDYQTDVNLRDFFTNNEGAYCLVARRDFENITDEPLRRKLKILYETDIFRRRLHLDKGFLKALIRLDQRTIKDYVMEKVLIVKN